MRILHFSDVHIGVENYGRTDPETGMSSRLSDFLSTFDEVVEYALENDVHLALFCGDAYKSRDPSQTHQREFAKRIARLSSAGIPVFLLVGNHDMPNVIGRATALEIFRTLDVPSVITGDTLRTYVVPTAEGPVQIVALPWIRRSAFLGRDDTRSLTPDQITEAIQERLTQAIRAQAESLDLSVPAIFAGHVSISTALTGSEQSMMLGRDHVLLKSSVALPQLDYVALGHIHRQQVLGDDPPVVYAGSLQRVDFGEEKDQKGFYVLDLDPKMPAGRRVQEYRFHEVDARAFVTVAANIRDGDPDPTATVVKKIAVHDIDGAIVRVKISIPSELESRLSDAEVRRSLESAHFVASISREIRQEVRPRLGQAYSGGLDPRETLDVYLKGRNVAADRAKVLMSYAETLMDEAPG